MKRNLLLFLVALLPIVASAYTAEIDGIFYIISGNKAIVTNGNHKYSDVVVIPKSVCYSGTTFSVTSIGSSAFSGCIGLTSITIPNSVTSIGNKAFSGCIGLTSITIPESVTSIGESAFYGCSSLTSITIPESVTSIGGSAFYGCSSLTSITIPESVTSIGDGAFSYCSSLTSITIPNSVTSIGNNPFSGCSGLTSIVVVSGNTVYDSRENCNAIIKTATNTLIVGCLNTIIPNSVASIGSNAFSGCIGLTSITIPNSVTNIGGSAFYDCYCLNTINCLNPTPPTCSAKTTFACSSNYVRDIYDVYNYAILHVPMGSGEAYASAYEWRYFNKTKEDRTMEGKVYYANLTVMQGTTGYTKQALKVDERYSIFIGSINENQINAVSFNGNDVTDELLNGYYTTPELKGESVLSISYITSETGISSPKLKNVRVTGYNGEINISNIGEPSDVFIYGVDGALIENRPSVYGSVQIAVPGNQLYMVKVGNQTYKIAL